MISLLQAFDDDNLFGPHFKGEEWRAWHVFLGVLFGEELTPEEGALAKRCTGRTFHAMDRGAADEGAPVSADFASGRAGARDAAYDGDATIAAHSSAPEHLPAFQEAWLICGRRSGKSRILALIAVYLATFIDWRPHLAPGERATVMVLAADRRQARTIMRYVEGLIDAVPMLRALVVGRAAEAMELANRVVIEIHTASFRSVRGYSVVAALLDECAFWRDETSANPDVEILEALRPAMATVPGAMLLGASSPYARRGVIWEQFRRHFANDRSSVLVWHAPTPVMNPTVPRQLIDDALERDPARAASEWLAEFRSDLEAYVRRDVVEASVTTGLFERPRRRDHRYIAFVDPSGGSQDSMTLAIAHREVGISNPQRNGPEDDDTADRIVLDLVREQRPPFSPAAVVSGFAEELQRFGISVLTGDRYAGEWPREAFRRHGIDYQVADHAKSDLYRELLPMLNSGRVELVDNQQLVAQLCRLERRVGRTGRDIIDHPPSTHDDLANAAAGALVTAARQTFETWTADDFAFGRPSTILTDPLSPWFGDTNVTMTL